jgi:hypothetical protein
VFSDFVVWESFLVPNGVIAFDDTAGAIFPGPLLTVNAAVTSGAYELCGSIGGITFLRKLKPFNATMSACPPEISIAREVWSRLPIGSTSISMTLWLASIVQSFCGSGDNLRIRLVFLKPPSSGAREATRKIGQTPVGYSSGPAATVQWHSHSKSVVPNVDVNPDAHGSQLKATSEIPDSLAGYDCANR